LNTFLISLGLALVTALTAALVVPSFVDWNGYRIAVEAGGSRLLGRPIEIAGDLDVRILPSPVVRAGSVRLLDSEGGEPFVATEAVELNLDLGALILGEIRVSDLALVAPEIKV
jgi:uncharacterized protein involved in outer membrane biogenesis